MTRKRKNLARILALGAPAAVALLLIPVFDRPSEVGAPLDSTGHYDIARKNMACAEGLCDSKEGMAEQVLSTLDEWAARIRAEKGSVPHIRIFFVIERGASQRATMRAACKRGTARQLKNIRMCGTDPFPPVMLDTDLWRHSQLY